MNKIEQLRHALNLAREDLWFLMNVVEDLSEHYISRAAATAEFATKILDDRAQFDVHRNRWINTESVNTRKIWQELAQFKDRYLHPYEQCDSVLEGYDADGKQKARCDKWKHHDGDHAHCAIIEWKKTQ